MVSTPAAVYATVQANGAYSVAAQRFGWTFRGTVGHPLSAITEQSGRDELGTYREVDFGYTALVPREASIRVYDERAIVLFTAKYLASGPNAQPFPQLQSYPQLPYRFAYHDNGNFGRYGFDLKNAADSPWLLFDAQDNGYVMSPASNFMVARTEMDRSGVIAFGIDSKIAKLPAGFTESTMLVMDRGINHIFETWGNALTLRQSKHRPANDAGVALEKIGYWTDNGATYYYNYDRTLGYAGTLQAVKDNFLRRGIALGYMELDSWWYPKGTQGGIYQYVADPSLFPNGLSGFESQLGLPLLVHARWLDASSPYRSTYNVSGNVVTDPRYWSSIMRYLAAGGVAVYEQDWLSAGAQAAENLVDPEAFLTNMAAAARANGLGLQYCMPYPRDYLQGSKYSNVLFMRVSDDRFEPKKWDEFLYGSRLASALGTWPWSDVFMSSETLNLLLSTLSAGPVGIGDAIGKENAANVLHAVRSDGVIVKPDAAIVPLDRTFIAQAQDPREPMVAATYTDHGRLRAAYVFAYERGSTNAQRFIFSPEELGITQRAYVYDYFANSGVIVEPGAQFSASVTSGSYYIVVPLGPSGIAFLGDANQFVSLGRKRIARLTDDGRVRATVVFAANESSLQLHGYSRAPVRAYATEGAVRSLSYDNATGLFSVPVLPGEHHRALIHLAPP